MYNFERLQVWRLGLEYDDLLMRVAACLPRSERFGLTDQLRRASSSITLNIAEGSTSQTAREQARFVTMAIRSFIETVACRRLAMRRGYDIPSELEARVETDGLRLFAKLQAFRTALLNRAPGARTRKHSTGSKTETTHTG